MSDGNDPATPAQDTGLPDSVETDAAALSSAEQLDEDEMRVDPLEEGIEPPEHWSEASKYGTTPFEEHQGETLDQRLEQEEPDVSTDPAAERPDAATPAPDLDEGVDYVTDDSGIVEPDEAARSVDRAPGEQGQDPYPENADRAGGSVADAIRTPESEPE